MSKNKNIFKGKTNFYGSVQLAQRDIINVNPAPQKPIAHYTPEPLWKTPFTLTVLTWISRINKGLAFLQFLRTLLSFREIMPHINMEILKSLCPNLLLFSIILLSLLPLKSLKEITEKQIRIPLLFNLALSGYGERITLERIHAGKCPICGGKMKYYNKPTQYKNIKYNGETKRIVSERTPTLECTRNSNHYFYVDPAEDKV